MPKKRKAKTPPVECPKCGQPGTTGTCPYAVEIQGDDKECNCCDDCRAACAEEI